MNGVILWRDLLVNQEFCLEHLRLKCLLDHHMAVFVYFNQEAKKKVKNQLSPASQCGDR